MKKRLIPVLILALAAAAWFGYRALRPQENGGIRISGNIELSQVDIAFKTPGRLVERAVDEGDPVQKGQVVARLDRDQLQRQREAQSAALAAAEAQLAQARTALRWQSEMLAADLASRRAEVNVSQARLEELRNGSRPQELKEAAAAMAAATAEFERARKDWERAQALFKNDDISASQFDQYRTRFESASAALQQAGQRESLVREGPRSETVAAARAQLERARAGLQAGEVNAFEVKRREQEIAAREAEISRIQAQIALIDSQLADTEAISPVGGVVLVKSADPGEIVAPGTTVLTVGDIDNPWLRGYIAETDLGRVKIGTAAHVTTDSFPGRIYQGRLTFISPEAEFTPKQIQTKEERVKLVYRVKIEVENPNRELKNNMPADAEILVP
jgi:HlyD family secretion protein